MPSSDPPFGVWPVMLTPFHEDGSVDWPGLDALTEWYLGAGIAGLFAVSGSSELYQLTHEERIAMAERVVARTAGRVPVVASAIDFGPIEQQAEFACRMAETGVQHVILATCQLARAEEPDGCWLDRAVQILALTADIPLGLYEIPTPCKRLLTPEQLQWAGAGERFRWFKDTCSSAERIRARLEATRGTGLRLYNANTATLLESLLAGGHGFSGIGANFCPGLYVRLCGRCREEAGVAGRIQAFLGTLDAVASVNYPASAKAWLAMVGLPVRATCRVSSRPVDARQADQLAGLLEAARRLKQELELTHV
jgi:4-hydroxy-tetrahydrodipicolinate synthase